MITITDHAVKKIIDLLSCRKQGIGIRIGIKTAGCSGLSYTLEYVDTYTLEAGVINYLQPKFCVLISKKDLRYLDGLIIDWVRNGLNEGFKFINPNERGRCGCGESFKI